MLCQEHRGQAFTSAAGPCSECGDETNSCYQLCEKCSTRFDECEYCRKGLNSNRDPRLVAAFKCEEAVAARQERLAALEARDTAYGAAGQVYSEAIKPFQDELVAALKPYQAKEFEATREFSAEFEKVANERLRIENDPAATAGEKLDARNRWIAAMNEYSAKCRPFREQTQHDTAPLYQRFEEQTAAFKEVQEAAAAQADAEFLAADKLYETKIKSILNGALNPFERFSSWISSLFSRD